MLLPHAAATPYGPGELAARSGRPPPNQGGTGRPKRPPWVPFGILREVLAGAALIGARGLYWWPS